MFLGRQVKRRHIAVAPNLHWRFTGVTSTIIATVPHQARDIDIVTTGPMMPKGVPHLPFMRVLLSGWTKPARFQTRIWHARRNDEMIVGILLRHVLRQPWTLVFTSAAQRRHTAFTRWLIRRMHGVIATTEAAASYLERPAQIIPHGVDHQRFHPDAAITALNRPEETRPVNVGLFSRIRPQKGTDLFVAAMLRLMPKYPAARAVICGQVTPKHQRYFQSLKDEIERAGLSERFVFLGELSSEDMPEWFARLDLFVAPMRSEGFGLTPLEAMASGVPVVATRTGASELTVEHGRTGLLAPPDDLDALTAAIDELLSSPEKRRAFGKAGRERTSSRFDIAQEAAQLNDFYLRLLGARESAPRREARQAA